MRSSVLFVFAVAAFGQTVPDQFIVELTGEPAALHAAKQSRGTARRQALDEGRTAVRDQQRRIRPALEGREADILGSVDTVANAFIIRAPRSNAQQLARLPGVKRVHPVILYKLVLDHALPLQQVPDAWAQIGGIGKAGAGIKIGIIDTGIDSSHPGFQDSTLAAPDGFPKVNSPSDLGFTNNKVIVARTYGANTNAWDRKGHGTAVSMIAAGATNTGPFGPITGVAPKAWLGSYKVFPDNLEGAPTSLILQALDDAVKDGMDVVNLSLGSLLAGRTDHDILVGAVEQAISAGIIVVIAAGNDGPDPATIGSPGTAPDAITVGNSLNDRVFAGSARLSDGSEFPATPAAGSSTQATVSARLIDVATVDNSGFACSPLPAGSLGGAVALILRGGGCNFEAKLNAAQQAGAVAAVVYTDEARPEAVSMSAGSATLPGVMVSYAAGIDIKCRAAADSTLTVAVRFSTAAVSVSANSLASSSSRGPSVDASIKPEILAVGTSIYTAAPAAGYTVATGTSLSAPMVTGAAALLKAARPGLTMQQYRSLLINSASAFPGGASAPVQNMGAGLLNMTLALRSTVAVYPAALGFGSGSSTIDAAKSFTITNLGPGPDTFTVTVAPSSGSIAPVPDAPAVALQPRESREIVVRFSSPSLAAGAYQGYVSIQGAQSDLAARVPYWYAVPTGLPRYLTILNSEASAGAGKSTYIYFRVTDENGVWLDPGPLVEAVTGGGAVVRIGPVDSAVPGAFAAEVRLGLTAGSNVFRVQAGSLTKDVTIVGTGSAVTTP